MRQGTKKILTILCTFVWIMTFNLLVFAQKVILSKADQNIASVNKSSSRYLRTNGIRIHYLEWNEKGKSTVILLHGLYETAETWSTIAPLLARDNRVIALDRRGAGLTDKPKKGYDFQTLAEDVLSFMNKMNLQSVRLVGHSAGAGVALTVAATEPTKIGSVILIDGGFWKKSVQAAETIPSFPCNATLTECKRRSDIERGSMDYDAEPLYERVSAPTLLIMAIPKKSEAEKFSRELLEAQSHVEEVAKEKLQKGKMVVIKETSHWIQRDQPHQLALVIKSFL